MFEKMLIQSPFAVRPPQPLLELDGFSWALLQGHTHLCYGFAQTLRLSIEVSVSPALPGASWGQGLYLGHLCSQLSVQRAWHTAESQQKFARSMCVKAGWNFDYSTWSPR